MQRAHGAVCQVCAEDVQLTEGILEQLEEDPQKWLVCLECRAKQITVIRKRLT